jgi:hypothetical protein
MSTSHAPLLAALLALIAAPLTGCDRPGGQAAPDAAPSNPGDAALAQDVAGIGTDVRLAQATKRIDELEREVAHLKSTPATLNLDLLDQRVQAIEARLAITPAASPATSPATAPRTPARTPTRAPGGLTLPEIEKQR